MELVINDDSVFTLCPVREADNLIASIQLLRKQEVIAPRMCFLSSHI